MTQIISTINQKGGVGKTTTAVNVAGGYAELGRRVLLIDMDPQTNASVMCGIRDPEESIFDVLVDPEKCPLSSIIVSGTVEGVDVAPAHRALAGLEMALQNTPGREHVLREVIETVKDRYDVIVIDNGPTLGLWPIMSLVASTVALVIVNGEPLAIEGLAEVEKTIKAVRQRLNPLLQRRIVPTMIDPRRPLHTKIIGSVREVYGKDVFKSEIPESAHLQNGVMRGGCVLAYAPNTTAAESYRNLTGELKRLK
jgi:chromosome partitioning protein